MEVLTETLIFIDYYLNQKFKKTKKATCNPSKLTVGCVELVGQHTIKQIAVCKVKLYCPSGATPDCSW